MSDSIHPIRFPGESDAYCSARNELLEAELELRKRLEKVAALRQKLPLGGKIKEDYLFEEIDNSSVTGPIRQTRLSQLFKPGQKSLIIYSFMYGAAARLPCPMRSCFLDGLDRYAPHITQRVSLAVVAQSSIGRIRESAAKRDWISLRLLSSEKNNYNTDYHAQTPEGSQLPACNVFTKTPKGIYHFYSTSILYAPLDGHPRHVDLLWPIWNFLDLTPEGRGSNWMPRLNYDRERFRPDSHGQDVRGYDSMNLRTKSTETVLTTGVGFPLSNMGEYFHWRTASMAASLSIGCPRSTWMFKTFPSSSTITRSRTRPDTPAILASSGYSGSTR